MAPPRRDQNATHGALFGEFNYQGNPCAAHFYLKTVNGNIPDEFFVRSTLGFCACAADVTQDGRVSVPDLLRLLGTWGTCCLADIDGNGVVAQTDLLMLLAAWGVCP